MIRLLVNAGGRAAGTTVAISDLDEDFAQQLLDAGQAEAVMPIDPAEPVLEQVGEWEAQAEAIQARLATIIVQAECLDPDDRAKVADAVLVAMKARASVVPAGLFELLALAKPIDDDEPFQVNPLVTRIDELETQLDEAGRRNNALAEELEAAKAAAATHTPPTESGTSGDAAGADAPAVEPAAPKPAPAVPPGGAARPRKSRG